MSQQPQGQVPAPPLDSAPRGLLPPELLKSGSSENAQKYAWPSNPSLLGTRVPRTEAPAKVSGRAAFTYDVKRPGMLYAKTVRSPHPRATIAAIDVTAAEKAPGVRGVLRALEPGAVVGYQGDLVAVVAADTEERARDAARLIAVRYEVLPHLNREARAMAPDAPVIFRNGNTRAAGLQEIGDLEAGFKAADHVIDTTYSTHVVTHVCLETHGAVCEWDGDTLTAWVSTQGVHSARQQLAPALGLPEANVRVVCDHVGGAFGGKTALDSAVVMCARLARQVKAPVRLMFERKEEHLDTGSRPSAFARVRAGVSASGMLTALDAQTWGSGGAGQGSNFPFPYIYRFPNRRRVHTDVFINAGPQRPMRAPGHPQGSFITEALMEELADLVKMDPVEFRIKNLPPTAPDAMWAEYFRMGASRFGWDRRHPTGDRTPGPIKTGMGAAANQWGGGGRRAHVHITVLSDGSVIVRCGTQDLGTGTRSVLQVIAAETLGAPLSAVNVQIGDTQYGFAGASGGSTTVGAVGTSARIAAGKARDALFARVAPVLEVSADALVAARDRIHVKDNSSKSLSWKQACKHLGTEPLSFENEWEPGLSSVNTSGVQFADVSVDVETGIVKVKRVLAIQDCGRLVNKLTAESQVYGGVIGSLNFGLFEDRVLDRNTGQMVNPNMESYLLAGMSDIPPIDVVVIDQKERGIIGIGEPPAVPTAAAIANAVRNAIGVTIRSLPLHPRRVLDALKTGLG